MLTVFNERGSFTSVKENGSFSKASSRGPHRHPAHDEWRPTRDDWELAAALNVDVRAMPAELVRIKQRMTYPALIEWLREAHGLVRGQTWLWYRVQRGKRQQETRKAA